PSPTLFPYTTLFRSSEALQLFTAAATAVIEEDGGEGSLAWRPPKQGAQSQSPAAHFDSLGHVGRAALGDYREHGRKKKRDKAGRSEEHTSELQSRFD